VSWSSDSTWWSVRPRVRRPSCGNRQRRPAVGWLPLPPDESRHRTSKPNQRRGGSPRAPHTIAAKAASCTWRPPSTGTQNRPSHAFPRPANNGRAARAERCLAAVRRVAGRRDSFWPASHAAGCCSLMPSSQQGVLRLRQPTTRGHRIARARPAGAAAVAGMTATKASCTASRDEYRASGFGVSSAIPSRLESG
jgi:hypothetical protein